MKKASGFYFDARYRIIGKPKTPWSPLVHSGQPACGMKAGLDLICAPFFVPVHHRNPGFRAFVRELGRGIF